ncbi:hypothetical protein FHS72_001073 [Loktanella ponticola]|uniref:Uncharacterized protein n=1 Tax=Yoonia ponticola TaxID=1524255 RepID=A0A7W9BJ51_9RHOB|nr:hypothetical protein [Yoonia ponticola]MBB5721461.1 hypothetical protein [Yoonia ponticola]
MWRLIKALVFLTALAAIGLIGYAYIGPIFFPGDFSPPRIQVTEPVTLDLE